MGEADSGKISMKLLVDRHANRVIFGEAGKEFVDFLFHFLSLPVATVVKLLCKDKTVGSLGRIYESFEAMHASYMQPYLNKESILNPKSLSNSLADTPFLFPNNTKGSDDGIDYDSDDGIDYDSDDGNVSDSDDDSEAGEIRKGGYVLKEPFTYMVMDDLAVKPLSSISGINLLTTYEVKDLSALETLEVYVGKDKAVDLLRASFATDKVLTSVFLGNQMI